MTHIAVDLCELPPLYTTRHERKPVHRLTTRSRPHKTRTIFLWKSSSLAQPARRSHGRQHPAPNEPIEPPAPGGLSPSHGLADVPLDHDVHRRLGRGQRTPHTLHLTRRPVDFPTKFDQRLRQRRCRHRGGPRRTAHRREGGETCAGDGRAR
jgi:hypothetical protein